MTGCVAPGSAIGRVGFSSTIEQVRPAAGTRMDVWLPKEYGLGGFDQVFASPEAFGHKDQVLSADVSGESVTLDFPPLVYHITMWLLPPLGARPKQPPPPAYFVRFSDAPDEVYLVGMARQGFDYRVYDHDTRQEKAKVDATWQFLRGAYERVEGREQETWHLKVGMARTGNSPLRPVKGSPGG